MSNIDNLNFKVILDDKDFNEKVQSDIASANALNAQLSTLLEVKRKVYSSKTNDSKSDKVSLQLEKERQKLLTTIAENEERVKRAKEKTAQQAERTTQEEQKTKKATLDAATAQEKYSQATLKTKKMQEDVTGELENQHKELEDLMGAASKVFSVAAIFNFAKTIASVTGEFESQRVALRSILKDVDGADVIFSKLQTLAIESPFTFQDLTSYAKQLAAFSVPIDDIYDTTKMLADISAGLGVDMSRIILAYGQVRSASFLRGQEVRQFTEAGIPLLQDLAKEFETLEGHAVSVGDVFDKISKRQVPFEMVDKVLKNMTSEGGQFFNMQSILADTLKGKMEKLKDAYQQTLNAVGEANHGAFSGVLDILVDLVRHYEDLGKYLTEAAISYGIFKTSVLLSTMAQSGFTVALQTTFPAFKKFINLLAKNPYVAFAAGLTALGVTIYNIATSTTQVERVTRAANKATEGFASSLSSESSLLKYLVGELENAAVGTKEYDKAKKSLYSAYGKYLTLEDEEAIRTGNLVGLYDRLADSIEKAMEKRFYEQGMADIQQEYSEGVGDVFKNLNKSLDALSKVKEYEGKVTKGIREELAAFVGGTKEFKDLSKEAQQVYTGINVRSTNRWDFYDIDGLRKDNERLKVALQSGVDSMDEAFANYKAVLGEGRDDTNKELQGFQKDVDNALTKLRGSQADKSKYWIKENNTSFDEYVDKLEKASEELHANIDKWDKSGYKKTEVAQWKKELEEVDALMVLLKGYKSQVKSISGSTASDTEDDPYKEDRKNLEDKLQLIQKIKSAYERLIQIFSKEEAAEILKKLFPDVDTKIRDNLDYYGQIKTLSDDMAKLGEKGAERASEILAQNGKDAAKNFVDAFNKGQKYFESMQEWLSKDFNISGTGAVFDISKIVADLNTANAKVDAKEAQMLKDFNEVNASDEKALAELRIKYGEEVWKKYIEGGKEAIAELAKNEKNANVEKAEQQLSALGSKYVKENLNLDLSGFSKKSLASIRKARTTILGVQEDIEKNGIKLTDTQQENLQKAGLSTEELYKNVWDIIQNGLDSLDDAKMKKIGAAAQTAGGWVSKLGSSLSQVGDAANDEDLQRAGEALSSLGSAMSSIGQAYSTTGPWGAAAAAITSAFTIATDAIAHNEEEWESAKLAAQEYADAMQLLEVQMSDDSSTIWGENIVSKINEAFTKSNLAMQKYVSALDDLNEEVANKWRFFFGTDEENPFRAAISDTAELSEKIKALGEIQVTTWKANWFQSMFKDDEVQSLKELAPDIFKDGDIDLDALTEALEKYGDRMESQDKEQLEYIKELKEAYNDLQDTIDDAMSELVGSLASDLTSQMVDNFLEAGDAVDDLSDSFQSLGDTILNSLLNSYIINDILSKYEPMVKEMMENYSLGQTDAEDVAASLSEMTDSIKNDLESSGEFINQMIEAFRDKGLISDSSSTSESSTLSEGIKSITEDTASLLASYINAIRADVSYGKVQRESIVNNLNTIASMFASTPTLSEYLAQIQANTYNNAVAAQDILAELRSVIAPYDGGGNAINVNN